METDLVKMSPKGQLIVPQDIREKENFAPGDRFVPFPVKDGVLFKRVVIPDVSEVRESVSPRLKRRGLKRDAF